jgi:pilus assembly protein Flp/PilA
MAALRDAPKSGQSVSSGGKPMKEVCEFLVRFLEEEKGASAVEYAVLLSLIIVVCLNAITTLGSNSRSTFVKVGNAIGSTAS